MRLLFTCFFGFWFFCSTAWAAAGFSSAGSFAGETNRFEAEKIIAFAKKVEQTLAAKGVHVAILARMGRPLSEMPPGMHFTHAAFIVYSSIQTADGRTLPGYSIYNLYQYDDQPDKSRLVQDFPVDFFSGVAQLEAGILIPSAELQQRLLKVIASSDYKKLHEPRYSVIANPFTQGRQNCTEFTLDVINSAIYQTTDIHKLKEVAQKYFVAQAVEVNPFKLMLGSIFSAEVATTDHPGKPVTATFERISDYLMKYDQNAHLLKVLP
ncbi:DUF2145 domain-containing protein [Limnohabitans sp. G3-2]|uniref:DUF2145 domain-containing protein n=1 Tax=Limnohabitans sp. G3-2 TaxID=1100711 RepID=UPI000C1E11D3|nr:DUF2145 domain-containing protein [Limnohabitans sp. G3-2]PIT74195.1 hypothetical protein B9Z31_10175 [Limnohabitans sp. G3-2]